MFLWEDERVNPQDMNKGFLRGELLVKVCVFSYLNRFIRTPAEYP